MAVDGSFSLESELKRFLHRCPKLKSVLCFTNLLEKGDNVTEDEVVHAAGQLLLHPNYTIPLLGCFRPIAQKIVERTVALLLLVPSLRTDDDSCMVEFDEDEFLRETETVNCADVASVIDIYVRHGKCLRLHELACLAFCRALDLIPFLLRSILSYFKAAPAPFKRIMQCESVSNALAMGANQLLYVVRASYRLLIMEPDVFTALWDWSCYLDLILQCTNLIREIDGGLRNIIVDIRWCSVGILSLVLRLSFKSSANLALDSEESLQSLLRWQEFCSEVSLEKGGWYLESSLDETLTMIERKANLKEDHCLKNCRLNSLSTSSSTAHEIVPSHQTSMVDPWNPGNPYFLTSTVAKSFEMVSLAVSQRWPVLLYGPAGVGKTALINKLAHGHGSRVLYIHMDEQIDGKTLIGSYVCTDQPGEFRWQPGSLTQAILNGFWVVFEDIDKAPPDILSILLSLLEGANLFSTGIGEAVRVDENFRIFSTVTSSNMDLSRFTEGRNVLGSVWRKVMIGPPSNEDLMNIVLKWYPELGSLAQKLIESFERVNQLTRFQLCLSASSSYHDRFTLRDLLKLCKRIQSLGFGFVQDRLSAYACDSIYREAVDVFASFSTSVGNRLAIMRELAKLWTISAAKTLYPVNKPIIQELRSDVQVGRVSLQRTEMAFKLDKKPFVELRGSVCALEKIACSTKFIEPVLLVGETGTGKTTLVQSLATRLGQKLTVLNLSQQSDVADLLGGFKPVDARFVCIPLYQEFENLFVNTFSSKDNEGFVSYLRKLLIAKNWKMLLSGFQKGVKKIVEIGKSSSGKKRKRPLSEELLKAWEHFSMKLERACDQVNASDGMVFSFVEGAFITALKNGEWILLDEVNLAPPEILQRVIGVLEDEKGSLCLAERGDIDYVHRHPNFRMFACMNPATDAGKRDLPFAIRSRFTEYFVDDVLDDEDLVLFINQFMDDDPSNRILISKIVQFYKAAKESEERLQDGANQKPHYSLRSLYRALEYLKKAKRKFGFEKSLYDGFSMFFLNLLDDSSVKIMNNLICKYLLGGAIPPQLPFDSYLMVKANSLANDSWESYVLTKSVKEHLRNLARALFIRRYPVLLQGPTSSGKTSLVRFLAAVTGHEFVRINNHEHTDLQEYLGSYITDATGKLVFHEGALVKAVRKGHWIVLDELNLAPSDVLEALNRLLDDNRELFVPELSETIRAHPDFMLFATQNPPVLYGGRKMLSRAFRNRFVEIHVDEIPQEELSTILEKRCKIPESHAKKMINVMKELQLHRQSSKIFAGKHGFITPRDLFRWADRFRIYGNSYEDLARDGYYLMAERLRDNAEKTIVKEVLERHLRVKLCEDDLYKQEIKGGDSTLKVNKYPENSENIGKIIWTKSMWRMYFLVERCYKMREPVLLVGETGGGKTTVCQLLSIMLDSKLHVLNCHQYTETSDFLGGFYPVRERSKITVDFQKLCDKLTNSKAFVLYPGDTKIFMDISQASLTIHMLSDIIKSYRDHSFSHPEVTESEIDYVEKIYLDLCQLNQMWQTIFMWQDGPLVEAMKGGDLFLADEISLADDSVLERLNSVLEPERKLLLAEKGGSHLENIIAHPNFFLLATMNPGGDYGKKELSPALRNRFTEIWIPSVSGIDELKSIALERVLNPKLSSIVDIMLNFWEWFNQLQTGRILTIRDLLSWISFMNVTEKSLPAESAFIHGAFLTLLDGLSLGTNVSKSEAAKLRQKCLSFLLDKLKGYKQSFDSSSLDGLDSYGWADSGSSSVLNHADSMDCDNLFGIHPFYIEKGIDYIGAEGFEFQAPTTRRNTLRVLRAMQLNKPVLLEGSPGVGKTSLIVALGRFSGHTVVRINLSEQTDIMDLLGSDLPVESDEGIQFAWSDGILLQALKKGSWVLLDELNLAPQSVLEGLNAILDHRAEVFIPELGCTFKCQTSFRVFACQNPSYQGGGRKGLPKSFLNRFTKVYVDELVEEDYLSICSSLFPSIERSLLLKLVLFNKRLHQETMFYHKFGQEGSPWEFNLRDVIRSCQIIQGASEKSKSYCFLSTVYLQRMRTAADRIEVVKLYEQIFGQKAYINPYPRILLNPCSLVAGDISLERYRYQSSGISNNNLEILPGLRHCLEAVAQCVKHQWLCILVGPASSGKTSLIRLLAELTGNVLNELNLSSATDISELLGCFEQYNASRHYHLAIARVERYINEYCNLQLENSPEALIRKKDLITRWLAFSSNINNGTSTAALATFIDNPRMRDSIPLLVDIIEHLKLDYGEQMLPLSWSHKDLDIILNSIRKLKEDHEKNQFSVKFEWVTGLLIKAIENGEWIVLENANLCNPTVLDRINSLVEQSGSITINECGTVEGKPVVLSPHPKFRMFLTVNPSYGEVSRAMRNRGVEIFLMQPYWLVDEICHKKFDEIELRDVKRFIALSGVPVGKLVEMMAKAHIYAMHEGSRIDVSITYLELSRWVQLFQQLITNGNMPAWSIQISWEHTYLSSFGEGKGKKIVSEAAVSYLSIPEFCRFTASEDFLLCLPGGWPTPLKLRDYICYSEVACVRQNCMYLESLGSQIASYMHSSSLNRGSIGQTRLAGSSSMIYLLDAILLHRLMFPRASNNGVLVNYSAQSKLDLVLAQKKLIFAADWVIEQATESDYMLYIKWFDWFGSQLQPFFSFFNWFSDLLKKEREHSIWGRILHLRSIEKDCTALPILSMECINLSPSVGQLRSCGVLLINSIKCLRLLRLSLRQWSNEDRYNHNFKTQSFEPVLTSLRKVEKKVLELLVESSSFDLLFKSYSDLLEHHLQFWNSIISSHIDCLLISWRSLMKDAAKLQETCHEEVEMFQIEMQLLDGIPSLHLSLRKSMLWAHGGHPTLPSTAELYQKQHQLSNLCEMVWPRKSEFMKLGGNDAYDASADAKNLNKVAVKVALSSNVELRLLALQGICMSSYMIGKGEDGDFNIIQQLEQMYQMFLGRLDLEKHKLEVKMGTTELASWPGQTACCVFTPDALCRKSGFECWLMAQSIIDETSSFLDLELLQHLTEIAVADIEEQHHALSNMCGHLESSLNFSLSYSSRPPTDFLPHQNILWTLEAWTSVQGANEKIASFILDMWLKWHLNLWETCPMLAENVGYGMLLPHKLFRPLKLLMVDQILKNRDSIREYPVHSFKLRAASRNIWISSSGMINSHEMLLSAARSLFQQIVYAHKKSFEDFNYAKIRSAFHSIQGLMNPKEDMKILVSLLAASNHHVFTSLIDSFIEPLLNELYPTCPSNDVEQRIGCALVRVGGLRFNLLICCDDLDPTVKYSIKHSELTEKIASLEIEIQVRKECVYLAGSTSQREDDSYRNNLLESLNAERTRLRKKMVFRPNPGKIRKLKHECDDFLKLVASLVDWINDVESLQIEQVIDQMHNWQETTSCFIARLSNEYSAYIDIIDPVRVAIYEMKLGLSLIFSSVLSKKYLANREQNMELVLGMIYTFMRFPRSCASKTFSINVDVLRKVSARDIELPTCVAEIDMNLLQNIVCSTSDTASAFQLKIAVYHNVLARIKISVANAHFLCDASFKVLHEILDKLASTWMDWMDQKHQIKIKEAQQFSFRARVFKIESITQIDLSNCATLLANDSFSEWQEMLYEELDEKVRANEEYDAMVHDWNLAEESNLDDMINILIQLFSSADLIVKPGSIRVSDADRLSSFLGSYMLGVKMIRDLKGSFSSIFDAKIVPENLLCLCLEHDKKFLLSKKSAHAYNFYKDSNSPMMAKLVDPIAILKQRILFLLKEWDEHPALQKILEVIDMILALPLDTPLAKALSGLQFLLSRVRSAQETVAKFPLSDQLEPIFALISSWHKMEFESWPALLDDVQSQFERNAGKLWLPLYSVFQRSHTADIDQYNLSTIQSLEDFFKTSGIGEFRKQLQLLLCLHGYISNELSQRPYRSPCQVENVNILYNTFGFYVQFLPLILAHIETNRRSIEMELKELLKLCRWDHIENHMVFENMKRTRQKLRKIIQKYSELLQQPLMPFLEQASQRGINSKSIQGPSPLVDPYDVCRNLLDTVCNQIQCRDKDSCIWFADWWKSIESVIQNLHFDRATNNIFPDVSLKSVGEMVDDIKQNIPSQSSCFLYWEDRKQSWHTVEEICISLTHCGELWESKNKNLRKRRALSDFLKLLDNCGLSKHRTSIEGRFKLSWLLQPSYEVQHLLLPQSDHSSGNFNVNLNEIQSSSLDIIWKTANKYYFKSIASMKVLEQVCLDFHKDFSLVQVKMSASYIDHLFEIQQEQRAAAYNFAKQLKCLRQCMWPLSNLFSSSIHSSRETISGCSFAKNQYATFKCMWQQKQLFDGFCSMMCEEHLLLQTVENNHLNTCPNVKDGVGKIRLFIQKVLPDFQKSKNLLDHHLLGSVEGVSMDEITLHPYGVSKEMEQLVNRNFELIAAFEDNVSAFHCQDDGKGAIKDILLGHFEDLFAKVHIIAEEFSSLQTRNLSNTEDGNPSHSEGSIHELKFGFDDALEGICKNILRTLQRVGSLKYDFGLTEESLKNVKEWKTLFEKDTEHLQLDLICGDVVKTIQSAGELLDYCGDKNPITSSLSVRLRHLYALLDTILSFGDNLLRDFLEIHSMVCKVSYALANIFASLFVKGFGTIEDQEDESVKETIQNANGTGMGEGAGLNDVSEQINDEDQLLGTSEKPNEDQAAMSDIPSKNEKGIEMEQDFDGEAFSVSEDSEDGENEDDQDEQLESAMGEAGANSEIVDEKRDVDDDENQGTNEKYESGPSVKDKASNDEELRAREDSASANEDAGDDFDAKESGELNDENENENENENEEGCNGAEDMNIDKDESFSDPSGINLNEQNQRPEEDVCMDELEAAEPMEGGEPEDLNGSDAMNDDEKDNVIEESLEEASSELSAEDAETANAEQSCLEKDTETDARTPKKDVLQSNPNLFSDNNATAQSAGQPKDDSDTADPRDSSLDENFSDFGEFKSDLVQASGLPNASEFQVKVADSTDGKRSSHEQPRKSLTPQDSLLQKSQPNPCRSVGDALNGWKERVKVSLDLQNQIENLDDLVDEDADEYGYTAEYKEGTAQALGPATTDQINEEITQNDVERDIGNSDRQDSITNMEIDKETSETGPTKNPALAFVNDVKKLQEISDLEKQHGESMEDEDDQHQHLAGLSESLVSVKRSFTSEDFHPLSKPMSDDELGKARSFDPSTEVRDDAVSLWRRYELLTTRLSQELAEQLRLVMEPTLASRLQGDYKTGKRINMKKVIPYVASHYRKDKIWLRRTRPSKRDYQVVIAVDDSRSMSEGRCGSVAIEALVTVCRAMSQLEIGNLAVASFGQQGNIRLLHDFDQPFTSEAGIKMISSLTFKQENTIADEPMADLLKYLNNMLDTAVMHARLPSGYNPLQQLLLIIADGRFNEKEKLKRYVRDILSKKRMVAFLLLDSPNESILDFMEATVQGKDIKFFKYLDSFPFPFYVVLKNIEALPRTLADLLRQWFELMQYSKE